MRYSLMMMLLLLLLYCEYTHSPLTFIYYKMGVMQSKIKWGVNMKPCKRNKLNLKGLNNFIIFLVSLVCELFGRNKYAGHLTYCDGRYNLYNTDELDGVVLHFYMYCTILDGLNIE